MKKKFNNIICTVLCLVLCGCASEGAMPFSNSEGSAINNASQLWHAKSTINVPYALNKSLNPYTSDSMLNLMLWPLMYDCLCKPDESFKPINMLAASLDNKGNTVTCKLVNAKFTDGSAVTSADVKYSFILASNSTGYFYSRVSNIANIDTPNTGTVVFTLKMPNPLIANMLDVPIIKASSDKIPKTQPIGSGRYIYTKNGNDATLNYNKNWFRKKNPQVTTIHLIDMPDDSAIPDSLEIGSLDYVLSNFGTGTPMSVSLGSHNINLNQIVYIGINSNNLALSDPHVRKAISLLINRNELIKDVFSSHALAAVLPFNPGWTGTPKAQDSELISLIDKAKSELALAGYSSKNSNGVFTKTEGGVTTTLDFTITVNNEDNLRLAAAQKIITTLKNAGFNINIKQEDFATYSSDIQAKKFDMYIGELKLADDMSLSPFFTIGSATAYNITQISSFYAAFTDYENNKTNLENAATAFRNETPFIPLCYRIGAVSYPRNFFANIITTNHDIFYNIEDWK